MQVISSIYKNTYFYENYKTFIYHCLRSFVRFRPVLRMLVSVKIPNGRRRPD